MKKIILIASMVLAIVIKTNAQGTNWGIDQAHSSISFTIMHMAISEVEGKFKKFDGKVVAPNPDFSDAQATFTAEVTSITTDNEMRDNHLKTDDFFNADKWPQVKFESTSFKKLDAKNFEIEGNLTIRDVTKKVKFNAVYGGSTKDYQNKNKAGFKATTTIKRQDFNVSAGKASMVVGDDVNINVRLELVQQ